MPIAGILGLSFGAGVAAEGGTPIMSVVIIVGFPVSLTAALIAVGGASAGDVALKGAAAGALAAVLLVLGAFLPYAANLGGRELSDFGGDIEPLRALVLWMALCGLGGGVVGGVCGILAWGLWLAHRRAATRR